MEQLTRPLVVGDTFYLIKDYWEYTFERMGGELIVASVSMENNYNETVYGFFSTKEDDFCKDSSQEYTLANCIDAKRTNRRLLLKNMNPIPTIPILPDL